MEFKNIDIKKEGKIAIVTISREKALNALNAETVTELKTFFHNHWRDDSILGVIITGAGKSFVAGADIKELADCDVISAVETSRLGLWAADVNWRWPAISELLLKKPNSVNRRSILG